MRTEESTINQEKSEKTDPEEVVEKANPEETLTITKVPPKILSRYLSARKSSCHDFCKYGIKHADEEKPWRRVNTRGRKTNVQTNVLEENVISLAGTKKSGRSSKPSLTSKGEDPSSPIDIKEVTNEKTVTSEKNSPSFEETDVSIEHHNSDLRQEGSEPSLPVQECSKSQTKRGIVKNKTAFAFGSSSPKRTESRSKQTKTEGKGKSTPPSVNLSPKHNVKKKPSSSPSAKTVKNLRGVSSLKTHENVEEIKHEISSNDNLPDKILHVIEPTSENLSEQPPKSPGATKLPSPSHPSSGEKILKRRTTKKIASSGMSSTSRKNLRHVTFSQISSGNKGKTNMVRTSSKSSSVSSSASSSISSISKQNGAAKSKSNKAGQSHQGENVKVGYKIRPKMSTKVVVGNKVVPPRKLSFRRGKVIEIQPQNNNIPRRLKFKPARLLGADDIKREINGARMRRAITNKKAEDGGEVNAANNANTESEKAVSRHQTVEGGKKRSLVRDRSKNMYGSKSASEKVILRHQNVEGKKQNSRLYNNVIEETAIKLAGLRKSKVKALVGAFETVISLDSPRAETNAAEASTAC
ncbi:uncharacterized protein LOC130711466 [Lotus japonicus]|uniref:uncharacterized protein LOC130711466 n=1 Tax=Lotus japonicus TaxID=34305 RepID=UPI002590A51F|nr:uncharacterized protein LOC130711466 [Lotus japonicus]